MAGQLAKPMMPLQTKSPQTNTERAPKHVPQVRAGLTQRMPKGIRTKPVILNLKQGFSTYLKCTLD